MKKKKCKKYFPVIFFRFSFRFLFFFFGFFFLFSLRKQIIYSYYLHYASIRLYKRLGGPTQDSQSKHLYPHVWRLVLTMCQVVRRSLVYLQNSILILVKVEGGGERRRELSIANMR